MRIDFFVGQPCQFGGTADYSSLTCKCPEGRRGDFCQVESIVVDNAPLPSSEGSSSDNTGSFAAIWAVAAAVVLMSLVAVAVYMRRNRTAVADITGVKSLGPSFNWDGIDESNDKSSPSETVVAVGMEGDYLELQEVPKLETVSSSMQLQALDYGLSEQDEGLQCHLEYFSVPKRKADASFYASVKDGNGMKNRYKDVLPCKYNCS